MSYLCFSNVIKKLTITEVNTIQDCLAIDPLAFIATSASSMATQPTLQDVFNIPLAANLTQMFSLGFSLPILCFMVAWAYGTVINFFDSRY